MSRTKYAVKLNVSDLGDVSSFKAYVKQGQVDLKSPVVQDRIYPTLRSAGAVLQAPL